MYNPPHFTSTDPTWLDWLAEHHPFGTLVSQVEDAPFASHLPVLYKRTDGEVTLTGHWARPNPQWREIETQRALFLFQGPHAYISPRWYADTPKQVPTWNYVAAHVYGTIRRIGIREGPRRRGSRFEFLGQGDNDVLQLGAFLNEANRAIDVRGDVIPGRDLFRRIRVPTRRDVGVRSLKKE